MTTYRATVMIDNPVLGGRGSNTWHFSTPSTNEAANILALSTAEDVLQNFYIAAQDLWPTGNVTSHDGEWTSVDEDEPTVLPGFQWSQSHGTGDPMPASQCIVIGWGTPTRTRYGRGRTFLGPLAMSQSSGGTPSSAALSIVEDAADTVLAHNDGSNGDNGRYGVWSEHSTHAPGFRPFTTRTVHDKFAVLRSRRD